jgi:hypothetical protein
MLTPIALSDATQTSSSHNQGATRREYSSYQAVDDTGPLPTADDGARNVNTTPRLEGMHAATATTTGWIEAAADGGPECFFCGDPARRFKPLNEGTLTSLRKLWWCRPCETTWVA